MDIRPGQIAKIVGGVIILISSFLDWFGFGPVGFNAFDGSRLGFTGILLVLLSLELIVGTSIRAFAPQVNLPNQVLGFSLDELALFAGFAAFIWGLSASFVDFSEVGTLVCALGGIVAVVGAFLEMRASDIPAAPPRAI